MATATPVWGFFEGKGGGELGINKSGLSQDIVKSLLIQDDFIKAAAS